MSNMNHELHHLSALDEADARPVGRAGIVGATPTGIAIVMQLLDAGVPVTLYEPDAAALAQAVAQIRSACADTRDRRLALLAGTVNFHHLKDADLLVDATEGAGREQLFHRLDQTARRGAILATTAADVRLDELARWTRRAGEVLGLRIPHGQAWEPVPGKETSATTLATAIALTHRLHGLAVAHAS